MGDWGIVLEAAGIFILSLSLVWALLNGFADLDERRRRDYLGLCRYCGKTRHTGSCQKEARNGQSQGCAEDSG